MLKDREKKGGEEKKKKKEKKSVQSFYNEPEMTSQYLSALAVSVCASAIVTRFVSFVSNK